MAICVLGLPNAVVLLWQVAQPLTIPLWLNVAPKNEVVDLWQVSHPAVVRTWLVGLPNAVVPL